MSTPAAPVWDSSRLASIPPIRLPYRIHSHSGHHAAFLPSHILTPSLPGDDSQRWTAPSPEDRRQEAKRRAIQSGVGGDAPGGVGRRREPEWIQVELEGDECALVSAIGFGKTTKPHPCNLSSFTLWGGPSPDPLKMELLVAEGALRNDAREERVAVGMEVGEGKGRAPIPIKYLRLDCHLAANANYSISIWHLFLEGFSPSYLSSLSPLSPSPSLPPFPSSAQALMSLYTAHTHALTSHALLAHLRRLGPSFRATFETLSAALDPAVRGAFEHPLLGGLHEKLVCRGDWEGAEEVLEKCLLASETGEGGAEGGLFREWSAGYKGEGGEGRKGKTIAKWEQIRPPPPPPPHAGAEADWPAGRGGHAMVRVGRKIVLFGGWDGASDLGSPSEGGEGVWEWDLPLTPASAAAGDTGGPWRRVLPRPGEEERGMWPGKRSCHALAVDEEGGWVYLLGGRRDDPADFPPPSPVAPPAAAMEVDPSATSGASNGAPPPPAAAAAAGQPAECGEEEEKAKEEEEAEDPWASDFWRYRALGPPGERGRWECLSRDTRREGGVGLLFDHSMVFHSPTQRLFVFGGKNQPYDPEPDVDDVLSGAVGAGGKRDEGRYSGLWCYDVRRGRWSHLIGDPRPSPHSTPSTLSYSHSDRLLSRAGHALLLDPHPRRPTIYIMGGQRHETYLQDLWAVRVASAGELGAGGGGGKGGGRGRSGSRFAPREEDAEEHGDSEEEESEEEDEEAHLWRQGAVLDLPPPPTSSHPSSTATSAPAAAVPSAVTHSLIDLSALPGSPESSPSRAPPGSSSSAAAAGGFAGPTILQIRRLWPPSPTATGGASAPAAAGVGSADIPPPAFTHRLTLDPHTRDWTLLTGLVRVSPSSSSSGGDGGGGGVPREGVAKGVWRRRRGKGKGGRGGMGWERVEEEWGVSGSGGEGEVGGVPRGRYASQVVYDPLLREHYLFGGHPESDDPNCSWRLDDFWKLKVVDPSPEEALRMAKFLVRKQRFTELCATAPTVLALQYLQTSLSAVVDHSSPTESASFRACMAALLSAPARMNVEVDLLGDVDMEASIGSLSSSSGAGEKGAGEGEVDPELYATRHKLFEELVRFFPRGERQPEEDLEDTGRLVRVWEGVGRGRVGM
ncbi:hypothetical protein JCM6882_000611 [Rhodosporidiobolus microsporus]